MGSYKWVISLLIGVLVMVALLIAPLITTREPPSNVTNFDLMYSKVIGCGMIWSYLMWCIPIRHEMK